MPTNREKRKLPFDIRKMYCQSVDIHQQVVNYEMEIISEEEFIDEVRKIFRQFNENLNISDVMNSKINESISVKDRLNKIERIKKEYGSESNQYIIITLTEITSILRDYFNVDEIEDDGPGGV